MDNRPPFDPSQLPPGDPRRQQQPYLQQPWFRSQQPQLSAAQQQHLYPHQPQFYAQQQQPQQLLHPQQTQPYPPQQQPYPPQQQPYPSQQQPYPQWQQQPHAQQQQPYPQRQPPYLQQQQPHAQQQQPHDRPPHQSGNQSGQGLPQFVPGSQVTGYGIINTQGYPAMGPGVSSLGQHTHPPASNAPVAAPAGHTYRTPMPQHTQAGVTHSTASMSRQTSASGPAPAGSQYLQTPGGVPTGIANMSQRAVPYALQSNYPQGPQYYGPMPSAHPQPLAMHATQFAGGRPTGGGVGVVLSSNATGSQHQIPSIHYHRASLEQPPAVTQANSVSTPHTTGATTMTEIAEPPNLKLDDVRMTPRNFSGTLPVQSDPKRRPGYITDFPQFPQPGPFGSAFPIGYVFQYYFLGRAFIPASRSPYTRDRDRNNRVSMTPSLFEKLGTAFESQLYALWRHVPYDNKKWRPCFATWYEYQEPIHGRGGTDGVYLAPMYSSKKPDNPTEWADYNFDKLPRVTKEWWLPVNFDPQGHSVPLTPKHPLDSAIVDPKYRCVARGHKGADGYLGEHIPVTMHWSGHPELLEPSFIWCGDPGKLVKGPPADFEAIRPERRYLRIAPGEIQRVLHPQWQLIYSNGLAPYHD